MKRERVKIQIKFSIVVKLLGSECDASTKKALPRHPEQPNQVEIDQTRWVGGNRAMSGALL